MQIYLSPVYIIILGLFIVGLFSFLRFPIALIASIAVPLIFYTLYLHVYMYSTEYKVMSTGAWVQNLAPTLLSIFVVVMSIGYIIYFFKKDKSTSHTSTNPLKTLQSLNPFKGKSSPPFERGDNSDRLMPPKMRNSENNDYISALNRLI